MLTARLMDFMTYCRHHEVTRQRPRVTTPSRSDGTTTGHRDGSTPRLLDGTTLGRRNAVTR
ncbi:MAG: hypothetical protein IT434_08215 [Phycisphaerales bacterium]|nr:hypothetical protein [Phycisphaerales bacterium]